MIYHLIVAVPSNFDIEYHLKLRELANIPDTDEIEFYTGDVIHPDNKYKMNVELLKQMAKSIAVSKVSTFMGHRPEMFEKLAEIFNDLGLVIHYKKDHQAGVVTLRRESDTTNSPNRFFFTCVNVLRVFEDEQWQDTLQNVTNLEDYYPPDEVIQQIRAAS